MAAAKTTEKTISIPALKLGEVHLVIKGTAPLISHAFSQKAKQEMLDKQMGKAKQGREKKHPARDFIESLHWITPKPVIDYDNTDVDETMALFYEYVKTNKSRFGFPAVGVKAAMVTACTSLAGVTKVAARQAFHVNGEYIELKGIPTIREDIARVGMGAADLRYRAEFKEWEAVVPIEFNGAVMSNEQIANILNTAGFAVGLGDYRPERDGQFGRFKVEG